MFELITPLSYWVLIVLWSIILGLYLVKLRHLSATGGGIAVLLTILALDAFRTLFESAYFGLYFNSLFGIFPEAIGETLGHPELIVIPKVINMVVGVLVLVLLIRRWLPREVAAEEQRVHELAASEERMHLALAGAALGTWDWNCRTGDVIFNERWASMLGYELGDVEPRLDAWRRLVHPDDLERLTPVLKAHLAGSSESFTGEFRMQHADGGWRWVMARGEVLDRDERGEPLRMCGTHLDITDRTEAQKERDGLQAQLLQSQKMEAVGRLAGGVAHDFNNVLCTITCHADLAMVDMTSGKPVQRSIEEISRAAQRAANLTRQLLAFSRKQVVEPKVIDLSRVIEGVHSMLTRLIGEDVVLRTAPEKPLWRVTADSGQVEQIVLNLVINARDAMPEGGEITLETCNVVLDQSYCAARVGAEVGEYVMLAVRDTGSGMSPETQARIFEPFFTTKEVGKGTGLGLATVFGIVEQHGGLIDVFSEPGHGSSFKVYFPRVEGPLAATAPVQAPAPTGAGETVLVVEDEATVRTLACQVLERSGYLVVSAGSGQEALDLSARHEGTIDLLLSDVIMPGMNGRELADALTALRPAMRVLFTSGYTDDVLAPHGVVDPGVRFIAKPYTPDGLSAKVRKTLDGG